MFSIRPIESDEWSKYREVRLQALQDSPHAFRSTYEAEVRSPDELWSSRVAAASASGKDRALFATSGGEVCGLIWCKVSGTEPDIADVFQMWVHPAFRRQGIGAALLQEALVWAAGVGVRRIRLGVTVADAPAMHLYKARGFQPVGAPELLREGSSFMAQTMELHLSAA